LDNKSAELEKAREVKMASTKQIPEKPQSVEQNAPKGAIPSLEGLLEVDHLKINRKWPNFNKNTKKTKFNMKMNLYPSAIIFGNN
jgi:hypothetical protein